MMNVDKKKHVAKMMNTTDINMLLKITNKDINMLLKLPIKI